MYSVTAVQFEHHREALGIGESTPRLSWNVVADAATVEPSAGSIVEHEIEITVDRGTQVARVGSESLLVAWPFAPLSSRSRAAVRARCSTGAGEWSDWSPASHVETGLLESGDWKGRFITASAPVEQGPHRRPFMLRSEFAIQGEVSSARLYISAHGVFEAELNGEKVGNDILAPGWTSYASRLRYQSYDVTEQIITGDNAIGVWLGDGWYRGRLGYMGDFDVYGNEIALVGQIEVTLTDGSLVVVATDTSWSWSEGPIISSDLYDGEVYDASAAEPGWSRPGFVGQDWTQVREAQPTGAVLVAPDGPTIQLTETCSPVSVSVTASGAAIVDFGQNVVGRVRIRPTGAAGKKLRLRHAEVLEDGELSLRPLRSAEAEDVYIHDGVRSEWEPRFTLHGFRYVELQGWEGLVDPLEIVACVYHSALERTGSFECADELVNRLHENTVWSLRGNFVDIPTDCPQRDERLGWTGDIQVFTPTAAFLYDCSGFLASWLKDLALEQYEDGNVPWVIPSVPGPELWKAFPPIAVWGDAAVLVPWALFEFYGDLDILDRQFDSAQGWVELVRRLAGDDFIWSGGFQLGDWLDPAAPPERPQDARTEHDLVATAYFAHSARVLAKMASHLGRRGDARRYEELGGAVASAFRERFFAADGTLANPTQTGYALAICFELFRDQGELVAWGTALADLAAAEGYKISTGFAGTPLVCEALTLGGQVAAAYSMLLQREYPSWLHPLELGATTIWERWDSLTSDGRVNPGSMTSFNHYALGSVSGWLHKRVAGISPLEPGFKRILFNPHPDPRMPSASATHKTPYGQASISWAVQGTSISIELEVPVGTEGVLDLPGHPVQQLKPGRHAVTLDVEAAARRQLV